MRIRITLRDRELISYLPINTNYYLSKLLDAIITKHQTYLEALIPNRFQNGRKFDLYTFSQLIIPNRRIEHRRIAVYSPVLYWYISSPYYQFISILAREFRIRRRIKIAENFYMVSKFHFLKQPSFSSGNDKFTCLSPISLTRDNNFKLGGKRSLDNFLLPHDAEYLNRLKDDTFNKLARITNGQIYFKKFSLEFDKDYIERKNNKISKLIAIEKNKKMNHYIRAVLAPFHISTTPDILKLIYDTGLGSFTTMGFGMIQRIDSK
jgi:CRISPR-associated endoribonuclease Cas6